MGFNVLQIKCADCAAFSPHSGFVSLSLYILFSHDKIVSSLQKYYFSSLLIIFEWKSLTKPRISLKCFTNPTFQGFKSPLFTAFFLIVHVLSCENNHSFLHLLNTTQLPILFIILLFASLILDISMEFRYTCVVFMELCPIPSLMTAIGMFISLTTLAQVCRAT